MFCEKTWRVPMSSAAPTKRDYTPNQVANKGMFAWVLPLLTSTVGMKSIVAVTGLALIGFVIGHMIGHLKMFAGPEDYNKYAKFLKDTGPLLWVARGGIIVMFVLHVLLTIRLRARSKAARPVPYAYMQTIQASSASRSMMWLGLAILAFVIFHLAHFTLGYVKGIEAIDQSTGKTVMANYLDVVDAGGRHDVYGIVVDGFKNPIISILYLFAMFVLYMHLSHGISSVFQTLGLNTPRTQAAYKAGAKVLALVIVLGYSSVVVAVWAGLLAKQSTFLPMV
jgi:succinate dehydrogenase / fumarate reductase, cytochrome b subunit